MKDRHARAAASSIRRTAVATPRVAPSCDAASVRARRQAVGAVGVLPPGRARRSSGRRRSRAGRRRGRPAGERLVVVVRAHASDRLQRPSRLRVAGGSPLMRACSTYARPERRPGPPVGRHPASRAAPRRCRPSSGGRPWPWTGGGAAAPPPRRPRRPSRRQAEPANTAARSRSRTPTRHQIDGGSAGSVDRAISVVTRTRAAPARDERGGGWSAAGCRRAVAPPSRSDFATRHAPMAARPAAEQRDPARRDQQDATDAGDAPGSHVAVGVPPPPAAAAPRRTRCRSGTFTAPGSGRAR